MNEMAKAVSTETSSTCRRSPVTKASKNVFGNDVQQEVDETVSVRFLSRNSGRCCRIERRGRY